MIYIIDIFCSSLIINESLDSGSQIPFIKMALLNGYDVIVMNINQRMAPDAKGNSAPVQVSAKDLNFIHITSNNLFTIEPQLGYYYSDKFDKKLR